MNSNHNNDKLDALRDKIHESITEYFAEKGKQEKESLNIPGTIQYARAIFDENEVNSMIDTLLDGWLGLGKRGREFSVKLAQYLGVSRTALVNSGSSANLLAIAALKSRKMKNPLCNGDEVITPAVTFPTTLNPIIQNNLTPILVDVDIDTLNIDTDCLNEAISPKTRALMIPHTLGNPSDMDPIVDLVEDHDLYLIEDNCDALGSEYGGKKTGSFGTLSTSSFYPAHHITTGEGGAISITKDDLTLYRIIRSLRDWGRDCWCESDEKSPDGACCRRFEWEINGFEYDHRYIYSHIGYNLKPTEIQAAMGVKQLNRIDGFNDVRRQNFQYLYSKLKNYGDYISFAKAIKKSNPAWFSFPIRIAENAPFSRNEITKYLERHAIQTRLIFAGNILSQPAYQGLDITPYGNMTNSDLIMKSSFFIGIHPGLSRIQLDYVAQTIGTFMEHFN
jgi:CDP-6-deoxy-D-xylo-4-hexulose-3-dehydrase